MYLSSILCDLSYSFGVQGVQLYSSSILFFWQWLIPQQFLQQEQRLSSITAWLRGSLRHLPHLLHWAVGKKYAVSL